MPYTTLISTADLAQHLTDPKWAVVDARFSLTETEAGRRDYQAAHIPGAVYAHLDEDLSGPIIPGRTGRHPLPAIEVFAKTLSHWGIEAGTQVVVYDGAGGSVAGRLWWMLRWLGHDAAAVLDGGWARWLKEGRPAKAGVESRPARAFSPHPRPELLAGLEEVADMGQKAEARLVDARAWERYRGEQETIDPVAGHIPGAMCLPITENLGPEGLFLPPTMLRQRFEAMLGGLRPEQVVFYCGSGVSAAHNILAMAHAGLDGSRLYVGSWSEWIADPGRPVATGDEGK